MSAESAEIKATLARAASWGQRANSMLQGEPAPAVWDVLIAGGGMAGLLTAARLSAQQPGIRIVLLERDATLGGRLRVSTDAAAEEPRRSGYGLAGMSPELFGVWQQTLAGLASPETGSVVLPEQRQMQLGVLAGGKIAAQPIEQWFTPKGAKTLGGMTAARQWGEVTATLQNSAQAPTAGAGARAGGSAKNSRPGRGVKAESSQGGLLDAAGAADAVEVAAAAAKEGREASDAADSTDGDTEETNDETTAAVRTHAFAHYWQQTRKTPAAIVLEHFANAIGIPDVWAATPDAIRERAAFHSSQLYSADWQEATRSLCVQPAFAAAVQVETGNRIVDARREGDLWVIEAEKGRYQARALIVAQPPWQATAWLRRPLWPAPLLQVASKTKPVSLVVLTERLTTAAAQAEVPDVLLVPAERVQGVRTGSAEICFQATIDYELSLQAPAVIRAVKSLKRAGKKLQQLYPGGVSETGHIALLPVAWAQSPLHSDRRWLERLEKKALNTASLAFCGDAYGVSYNGDVNLIKSVNAACAAVSTQTAVLAQKSDHVGSQRLAGATTFESAAAADVTTTEMPESPNVEFGSQSPDSSLTAAGGDPTAVDLTAVHVTAVDPTVVDPN